MNSARVVLFHADRQTDRQTDIKDNGCSALGNY